MTGLGGPRGGGAAADLPPASRVIVDLSNLTREKSLGPSAYAASLHRWDKVRAAWVKTFGEPPDGFLLVADANLMSKMGRSDQRRLQDLVADGIAEIASEDVEADDLIFDHLTSRKATVLALDKYRDKMKRVEARNSDVRYVVSDGVSISFPRRKHERMLSAEVTRL